MGQRGPAGKPLKLHEIEGSFRKDRHGQQSVAAKTADYLPVKPADLDEVGGRLWDFVCMERKAWLAQSDGPSLRAMCDMWGLRLQVLAVLKEKPTDRDLRNAFVSYHNGFMQLASKFGLTPSDRARLGEIVEDEDSILAEYLK